MNLSEYTALLDRMKRLERLVDALTGEVARQQERIATLEAKKTQGKSAA